MDQRTAAPWWKRGVIYQVYPRSFQDGDGDGVGDLAGLTRRLGYLAGLGVEGVWLSPVYPSPMADFGYDITDHCAVDPLFGSLADLDRLVAQAHARGLKLVMDFVPNHTSDRHPWFAESRASRRSPRRDWYIWRDPAPGGGPPNNWLSNFGGSSWTYDEATGQYYLHAFLPEQPDLNWANPEVRAAMFEILRFWLDRGVDGFRIDVLWHIAKAPGLPDNPPNPAFREGMGDEHRLLQAHSADQPEAIAWASQMRRLIESYPGDRVLIGEIYLPTDRLVRYYGPPEAPACHLPFNFQLIGLPWRAPALHALIADYEAALPPGAWPNWVLGNHDRPRIAARLGEAQARVAAMLLLTLRGSPTLYYGDELGVGPVTIPPERVRDPWERNEPGLGRDSARTPIAWDDGPNGGFTTGEPWLPLHADWPERNVAAQDADSGSMLALYRRLLALRRGRRSLSVGALVLHPPGDDLLVYERHFEGDRVLVALNLGPEPRRFDLPTWAEGDQVLVSTLPCADAVAGGAVALRPNEGLVIGAEA